MMYEAVRALAEAIEKKETAVLATVVEISGASPIKLGAQLALLADGQTIGTVGGGNLEAAIIADAQQVLETGQPKLAHYALTPTGKDAVDALCGGDLRVFLQPYKPPPHLVIVGGGHIGQPLQIMGELVGFTVSVVDVQPKRANIAELQTVSFTPGTYVVLITTDYASDEAALRYVIATPTGYIGMIGSRAKCRTILDKLRADGASEVDLQRVHAPIGLDLGGPAPAEIALAILAEIVAVRHKVLTPQQTAVHPRNIQQEQQHV